MKIIIPMAGMGDRFLKKNYDQPKPLIYVNGKRIIEYILDIFDKKDEYVFICNNYHLDNTNMRQILLDLVPNCKILSISQHKNGPVYSVLSSLDIIDDNEEVLISYCDSPFIWNREKFFSFILEHNLDGCLITHTGFHPHTLESTKMAFIKESKNYPLISEVQEKKSYTNSPQNEHASSGAYYFKFGSYVKKYFLKSIQENIHYKNEYYITLVYNLCIQDNLRIGYYDVPTVMMFGTPESVENFESWIKILHEDQCRNLDDVINCYNYWKQYYENYIS